MATLLYSYVVAGFIGGAIPANRDWQPPQQGVRIYVEDNGVHTGIILPVVAAGVDWRDLLRPEHLADPRYARNSHAVFGWGDRDFYLNTPSWAEVNPLTVLRAATGSPRTLMHVDRIGTPRVDKDTRTLLLRPEEYRRLAAFIRASFAIRDGQVAHRHGYAGYDAFYDANGRYSAIRTCNSWTGEALRAAGVRMGAWTPFPATVMQWLPDPTPKR